MNFKILIILILFIGIGCSKDIEINKADSIPGYWQALEKTTAFVNGIRGNETTKRYYIEFYANNCGQLYDVDENPTSEFKWAFQENDMYDRLLISTELTSTSGSSSGLSITQLFSISNIKEMSMRTFRQSEATIDGDEYNFNYTIYLVRQP